MLAPACRSRPVWSPHQAAAQVLLLGGAPISPAPAAVYVLCNGRYVAQQQSRSAEATLQQKGDIIQAQGVCLRVGEGLLRGLGSNVQMLEASAQQADQQLGHMAHELAADQAKYAFLFLMANTASAAASGRATDLQWPNIYGRQAYMYAYSTICIIHSRQLCHVMFHTLNWCSVYVWTCLVGTQHQLAHL